jgi:hypothetical protein
MTVKDGMVNGGQSAVNHITHPTDARSLVRAELAQIAARFEQADRSAKRATTIKDREAAEAERREAAGDFWAAGADLADLLLLLFRYATTHQPDALRAHIVALLRPEFDPIAEAIANLEGRQ